MSRTNGKSGIGIHFLPLISPVLVVVISCTSAPTYEVGVARMDITPAYSIRLAGYSNRQHESEGVEQRLWAKAMAIQCGRDRPAVLLAVDNIAIPAPVAEEIASRLNRRASIPRERVAVCATHIHTGPCLKGVLPTMFGGPLPAEHLARIDRYTSELTDQLEEVSLAALADLRPARLAWAQGKVGFAMNRRVMKDGRCLGLGKNPEGPVDHSVSMLCAQDMEGRLRAVVVNYACHCTTLGGEFNRICGDWAGYAQAFIEQGRPGVTCLATIGCGADADPQPRRDLEYAKEHGREMAGEVDRLLGGDLKPIGGDLTCRFERIELGFAEVPGRAEWEGRAGRDDLAGYHAKVQLARLDRGEDLQAPLSYPLQTWSFGEDLAAVFLGGEVVVDYVYGLREYLDGDRLWVTAYANDVPCYIPSRRVLAEGGYEPDRSMLLYGKPGPLAPETEDRILLAVRRLVPGTFAADRGLTGGAK